MEDKRTVKIEDVFCEDELLDFDDVPTQVRRRACVSWSVYFPCPDCGADIAIHDYETVGKDWVEVVCTQCGFVDYLCVDELIP